MADTKLTGLSAVASRQLTDLAYLVTDPSGSAASKKITIGNLLHRPYYDFVEDFGADPTGAADCSAILEGAWSTIATAGGGVLYCPAGIYLLSRALQDTSVTNAQVKLPKVGTGLIFENTAQVGILTIGAVPIPTSGASTVLPAAGYTVFKSTLAGATGTQPAVIGHPFIGTGNNQNNLSTHWRNLIFQLPPNPTMACLNLGNGQDPHPENVFIHTGALTQATVTQPTHPAAVGIIMNKNNMANMASMRNTIVWGMYAGYEISELLVVGHMVAWSCAIGVRVNWGYHANQIQFLGTYECPTGISAVADSNDKYLSIGLWDVENANGQYQSWQDVANNVDDASNKIKGKTAWHAVDAGVGVTHTLVKNGGTNFATTEL